MRRNSQDLEIQQRLLREEIVPSPSLHAQGEAFVMAWHRRAVEEYHDRRGTRHLAAYNSKAAQLRYEVPYYEEAKRLDPVTTASPIRYPKLEPFLNRSEFLRRLFRILCAPWLREYMPLSYVNFQLFRV